MKNVNSRFYSDGAIPGLSGLSGAKPGDRTLYNTGKPYTTGDDVKFVQGIVGTTVDGAYGPNTQAAVEQFQRANGLDVTGVVNAATWSVLIDGNARKPANGPLSLPDISRISNVVKDIFSGNTDYLVYGEDKTYDAVKKLEQQKKNAQKGGLPTAVWIGAGAVAVSLVGVALASGGDNK